MSALVAAPPTTDALTRNVTDEGILYEGGGRSYLVHKRGAKVRLRVEVDGSAGPVIDTVDLHSARARKGFAERLAGELNPSQANVYEQDLLQIVEMETEANAKQADNDAGPERVPVARLDGLIDLVLDDGRVSFLLRSAPAKSKVRLVRETLVPSHPHCQPGIVVPPRADQLPFLIPQYGLVQQALKKRPRQIWDEVAEWISSCSIPPDGYLDLEVAFAFHTHITDRFTHSPILALVGPPEYGKTRQGKAIVYVARRGIWTEMPREAHVLRYADDLDATLFLDLWDAWGSIKRIGIEDVILQRFEQGARIARVNKFDAGPFEDTRYYSVYGPTILASNTSLPPVLMSRSLPVPMRQQSVKPLRYPQEKDALPLRAALIAWRANTQGTLPEIASGLTGRLADIATPLLQVTQLVAPDRMDNLLAALEGMRDQRYQRNAETWEGRVISALIALQANVGNGLLPVGAVANKANEGCGERTHLTEQHVSNVLRDLGFTTKPYGHERRSHVLYDEGLLRSLAASQLGLVL